MTNGRATGDAFAIGVDIGGTTIKAGAVTTRGVVSAEIVRPSGAENGPDAVLSQAAEAASSILRERTQSSRGGEECVGVGVGIPGIVSAIDGLVRYPPNFKDWGEIDVTGELARRTGTKVLTENDANTAALAEAKFGAGVRHKNFIFVIWGTGVGGGLILDGKIYRGPTGGAAEIGHVSIDREGPACNCGNRGCVESYIGQKYLSARTKKLLAEETGEDGTLHPSAINALVNGDLERINPEIISRAAELGDHVATTILSEAGSMLGVALASVVNVVDIETVIIGGGISAAPDFVFHAVAAEMRSRVLRPHRENIVVERSVLGNSAGIIGAASLLF